jgi:hypothetical protein
MNKSARAVVNERRAFTFMQIVNGAFRIIIQLRNGDLNHGLSMSPAPEQTSPVASRKCEGPVALSPRAVDLSR